MRVFGLIGKTLKHSFSADFFREKFNRENYPNCNYKLFPISKIEELLNLIQSNSQLEGLNVTIPYKQSVIPFLDSIDLIAQQIGAVNTIKIRRENNQVFLEGFNTDAFGFQHSSDALQLRKSALILGTGGSAQAVKYVLRQWEIPFLSVSRNPETVGEIGYDDLNKKYLRDYPFIINTTPLGMFPDVDACSAIPYQYLTKNNFLFDLIYNPAETKFLKLGKRKGAVIQNGELMLELQAERSWEIWNS